ncbi:conserved hypothetical protein [Trichinella spiralis]|uniref:hypothetical protein n=1 Tax=Trichinella spiralis TaxID=6334 RepID=UPI0001EFB729|nr:conserved hypothetical protein [Trichinella spiralis]XP_003378302.1 conserved hypothetical protein [Trichinella spiralis]
MNLRRNKWSLFGKSSPMLPNEPDSEQILCLPFDPIEFKPKLGGRQDVHLGKVGRKTTDFCIFPDQGALLDEAEARVDKLQATQATPASMARSGTRCRRWPSRSRPASTFTKVQSSISASLLKYCIIE